ncbi:FtsX-like permease family protein [Phytomonospora sp. NPDC050363]|uniref:ABC transporter permease n=1 Tax=Phytomonospora sp. NPDC050363 TaxID=3155642 RepID=UPI0033C3E842
MRAVWRAARAAIRRRRLQTGVIGVVLMFTTATIVMALALLEASSAPFDRAFEQQRGAHAVVAFDNGLVSDEQLAATSGLPGVEAAGPFGQVVVETPAGNELAVPGFTGGRATLVGRASPEGSIDEPDLWKGRWATAPGEVVLNVLPPYEGGGMPEREPSPIVIPGGPTLTIVGYASSLSATADGWVSPEQMAALGPTATQMLYRFDDSATAAEVDAGVAAVTAGLPDGSTLAVQSYLSVKEAVVSGTGQFMPFLVTFGLLGLVVAILIVANVISGAVVSGFRHIGVLKAIGFTPRQVVGVYLLMVSLPAVVGAVLGTVIGHLGSRPLLVTAFRGVGLGVVEINPWVDGAAVLGMPLLVMLAALVPALRAHRLPAAQAISAGSTPRAGRGRSAQRWLSGTRLPRSVSLGLGLPLVRPGRTLLTMAAVVLGVMTVTFATGLVTSVAAYAEISERTGSVQVYAHPANPEAAEAMDSEEVRSTLAALPGADNVLTESYVPLSVVGYTQGLDIEFIRGDTTGMGYDEQLVGGRWIEAPGEVVLSSKALDQLGRKVGDRITLELAGGRTEVTVVGRIMGGELETGYADWALLAQITPGHEPKADWITYQVRLEPGTDVGGYVAAAAAAEPGIRPQANSGVGQYTVTVISLSTTLTLVLGTVAALGVFNTVVLTTRERRRDLGMLKSIGMTPRQVVVMMVTSMGALGVVGGIAGLLLGVLLHRQVVPIMGEASQIELPVALLHIWEPPTLALLAVAGVAIAVLGAYLPARSASRLTIAEVLHNE